MTKETAVQAELILDTIRSNTNDIATIAKHSTGKIMVGVANHCNIIYNDRDSEKIRAFLSAMHKENIKETQNQLDEL